VAAVTIESGIAGSTLFAHPATERNQQGRIYNDLVYKSRRDKIGKPGIAEEKTCTVPEITPMCAAVSRASASI
jgi:hypothetical protein